MAKEKNTKEKKTGKELAAPVKKQLATSNASLLEQDAGVGQESFTKADLAIPRLKILQDLSPERKKSESKYIEGAEVGQIIDTISQALFDGDKGIEVIPVAYRRAHLEWKANRGGFVADHGCDDKILDSTTRNDKNQNVLPNGNIITVIGEYFVFLIDGESYAPYVLSFAGTQLKKSRQWNTMINQLQIPRPDGSGTFNPAMFARSYNLSTVPERNDQGSWMGWKITPSEFTMDLPNGEAIYIAAREFRKAVAEGRVKASAPVEQDSTQEDDESPM